jgi:hypothetical protein
MNSVIVKKMYKILSSRAGDGGEYLNRNKVRPRLVYDKFSVSLLICGSLKD